MEVKLSVCLLFSERTEEKSGFSNKKPVKAHAADKSVVFMIKLLKRFRKSFASFTSLSALFLQGTVFFLFADRPHNIHIRHLSFLFFFFCFKFSYTFLYFSFPGSCGREGECQSLGRWAAAALTQHLHTVSSQFSHQQSNHPIPPTTSSAQCLFLEPQQ